MTDIMSPEQRSARMSRIRGINTKPELLVRRLLHRMGYRYRLHVTTLPGRPDIVFSTRRKAIFVHGCFWHRHSACKDATLPKSRKQFWRQKLQANVERDRQQQHALIAKNWDLLVVWECELSSLSLPQRLVLFLGEPSPALGATA
jgi:DNA mismatch endonuclease (patch repair protein)